MIHKKIMKKCLNNLGDKVGNFLRVAVWSYLLFCVVMWCYYMITSHEISNNCSFFSFSAHIGFLILVLILILLMICT